MKYIILLIAVAFTLEMNAQSKREFKTFDFKGNKIKYAIQLPSDYDASKTYPIAIGPSDATAKDDQSHYWRDVKDTYGWILLDFPIYKANKSEVIAFMDHIRGKYKVEGDKFHTICFSANSASIFDLVMAIPEQFHSITGMAGNPGTRNVQRLSKLKNVKVQFVVGDKDTYWMNASKDRHAKLLEAGVVSQIEIIKDGRHVLTELVGEGVLSRMNKLRMP